jgi:hypothetical protein
MRKRFHVKELWLRQLSKELAGTMEKPTYGWVEEKLPVEEKGIAD